MPIPNIFWIAGPTWIIWQAYAVMNDILKQNYIWLLLINLLKLLFMLAPIGTLFYSNQQNIHANPCFSEVSGDGWGALLYKDFA